MFSAGNTEFYLGRFLRTLHASYSPDTAFRVVWPALQTKFAAKEGNRPQISRFERLEIAHNDFPVVIGQIKHADTTI